MKYCVSICCLLFSFAVSAGGQCKSPGCPKYAGRSGYCEMHRTGACSEPDVSPAIGLTRRDRTVSKGTSSVKEFSLSSLKSKLNQFNIYKSFDCESRTWTDKKGRKLIGTWTTCTKDDSVIYVKDVDNGQYKKVYVSGLSAQDKKYVNDRISACHKKGMVWDDGMYFNSKVLEYTKEAEKLVVARSPKHALSYKIYQLLRYGALAQFEAGNGSGASYEGKIFFLTKNVEGLFSDNEELYGQLFWASTYDFVNKLGSSCMTVGIRSLHNLI